MHPSIPHLLDLQSVDHRIAAVRVDLDSLPKKVQEADAKLTAARTAVAAAKESNSAGLAERTMDCMDCHNRPAHSYDLPERGIEKGMNNGSISATLPFAKKKAVEILKDRRSTQSDLLRGKAALTPDMALRIEKAFGPAMDHLLRMQLAYDVAKTRERSD